MGMLSQVGNPLDLIKFDNLMGKYGTLFYGVDRLTGDLYAIESNILT